MRISAKVLFGGGRNKEEAVKERVKRYLGLARGLRVERYRWERKDIRYLNLIRSGFTRAKSNKGVELWRNILVASDQWGFVVDHQVVERQAEVSLSIPLAERLLSRFGKDAIESISFDKGFYKRENKELLNLYIPEGIMPKKGKKNQSEQAEESGKSFQKLRHKHSAIESDINPFEHPRFH